VQRKQWKLWMQWTLMRRFDYGRESFLDEATKRAVTAGRRPTWRPERDRGDAWMKSERHQMQGKQRVK